MQCCISTSECVVTIADLQVRNQIIIRKIVEITSNFYETRIVHGGEYLGCCLLVNDTV
jgi:hypothetical protein